MPEKTTLKNTPYDVAIAGAGPVGLSLAILLAQNGLSVVVLEKKATTADHSRAPAIWPGTQQILAQMGVVETFLEKGISHSKLSVWDVDKNRTLFTAPLSRLHEKTDYPQLLILPQSETERLLLQHLQKQPTAEICFSHEVTQVTQSAELASLHYLKDDKKGKLTAKVVVGADGAHSLVRESINASLEGRTYPLTAALADVLPEQSEAQHSPRMSTDGGLYLGIQITATTWRIILPIRPSESLPLPERVDRAVQKLFGTNRYQSIWQQEFKLHRRLSTKFAEGRVVLVGDAAHLNSPVGGQGMNAGIQDTLPLADTIAHCLQSGQLQPLHDYAHKRRKEIKKGVNRFTDIITRLLLVFAHGRLIKPILYCLGLLMRIPRIRNKILMRMAMLK